MQKLNIFGKYIKVLKLARKPSNEEFFLFSKLTLLGIGIIGIIGFIIKVLMSFLLLGI